MKTLTKLDLALALVDANCSATTAEAYALVDELVSLLKGAVFNRNQVLLSKTGVIWARYKRPRVGRNPRTKEEYPIVARHQISISGNGVKRSGDKYFTQQFVADIRNLGDITKVQAVLIANVVYKFFHRVVEEDVRIEIRGFGSLSPKQVYLTNARNPRTGELIGERRSVRPHFKCSPSLRKAIDKKYLGVQS